VSDTPVQLLSPDGELTDHPDHPLDVHPTLARDLLRRMVLARRLDEEALHLQRQGELGLWLQCRGQEAAQVGAVTALDDRDRIFPSYREHAAALCRGVPPAGLLAQWRGCSAAGWDPEEHRFGVYTLVLAAQLLHAVGYAMGVQRDGADEIVLACLGDGAASEGDASEALNWAATTSAPVLFLCQNNQFAISTPTRLQQRAPLHQRARGFGLDAHLVDGNDVFAVHAVTASAAAAVRAGAGPALIEAVTYRMGGHSSSDDPSRYRDDAELAGWTARDPITRVERLLDRRGWADAPFRDELQRESDELAAQVRAACLALAAPEFGSVFAHVLAGGSATVDAERSAHAAYAASFLD